MSDNPATPDTALAYASTVLTQAAVSRQTQAATARDGGVTQNSSATRRSILIFYGFSGDQARPFPAFPNGDDHVKSFQLAAETMKTSLEKLFPDDTITVVQAWTKDKLIEALERALNPIREVHIFAHGDSSWLSLAYHYDSGNRLKSRA